MIKDKRGGQPYGPRHVARLDYCLQTKFTTQHPITTVIAVATL